MPKKVSSSLDWAGAKLGLAHVAQLTGPNLDEIGDSES
jgi:hypothetical protein